MWVIVAIIAAFVILGSPFLRKLMELIIGTVIVGACIFCGLWLFVIFSDVFPHKKENQPESAQQAQVNAERAAKIKDYCNSPYRPANSVWC